MADGGYMGKILFVDLSNAIATAEPLDRKMIRHFIGGYGLGARILYSRQRAGVDALDPENLLGFTTGPLTGTPVPSGARYQVVARSPLTGGWGDANSGGQFGPYLKFAGVDAVFVSGTSPTPVCIVVENGQALVTDATGLWGKDAYETEELLMAQHGRQSRVACIGPAGEHLSLIASIMTDHGSAAARSGLGAVMGSKKLKAVVAKGDQGVPMADRATVERLRMEQVKFWQQPGPNGMSYLERWHTYGTSFLTYNGIHSGDTPIRNWGGVGIIDIPDKAPYHEAVVARGVSRLTGCWHCPIACKALMKVGTGEYPYVAGSRRPEYETAGAFGGCCGNNNIEAIAVANDICNRAGLDTISAGSCVAFAIECFENGILSAQDTGGIELRWGNHQAMVAMTRKLANREGLGEILADGVKRAAQAIGRGAEQYAVHAGGQELGMHDPKLEGATKWNAAARYQMDATPGRHTQGFGPSSFQGHVVNALGICVFGSGFGTTEESNNRMMGMINGVTGWDMSMDELLIAGERIANMRHAFNLREGIREREFFVHPRIVGNPPLKQGPLAGVTADLRDQIMWNLGALDWDHRSTRPSRAKLLSLGLKDVASDLWTG